MSKKLIYLISALVLSMAGNASADLVVHWSLDEGSGTTANDFSGNGNDGTLNGDPQWATGKTGGALEFDGTGDYVEVPRVVQDDFTLMAWIKTDTPGLSLGAQGYQGSGLIWSDIAGVANDFILAILGTKLSFFCGNPDVSVNSDRDVITGEWVHVTATRSAQEGKIGIYINGEHENTIDHANNGPLNALDTIAVGGNVLDSRYYTGLIDDVRIYDHVLSGVEVLNAMQGQIWPYAWGPEPADGALHPDTWVNISWNPGGFAVSHDVYLSDNFDNVNDGTEDTFQGNQLGTFLVAGFPGFAYPDGLVPGTTYYWRIDEVNDTEPNSPWKGEVWSFSIPPKTAYYPEPADGAELVDPDITLSWTAGFGAKLHTVYFGDNFDDVNNAAGGSSQGTTTYTPSTLKSGKTYYWRVDEFDIIDTYKGDVWSFTTQGAVVSLKPSNGAVDVKQTQILTWSPGDYAASHEVYFSTDKEVVRDADTSSPEYKGTKDLGSESYDPGKLEWDSTYYWRIDEVNNANPDSPWIGPVWSFTTANFLILDDFESYNDLDPADPDSNRIFNAWLDGYDDPTNGSLVGYDTPPFAEQTIVHSGNQSMPLFYDNSVGYSEATLTLTYPRDWTEKGVNTLTIWFRGNSDNAAETLYAALNGNAVVTNDNPDAAQLTTWTEWTIDLQAFADQGVNLANVNTIALGLGNRNNPVAGGSGTMYFDDIRLYPPPTE
ncbi:MAG TPA: LamG domain-containing protein [Sedimentisphaerales bacterium]|nr:LamG domain-containing protein [Sedimentisphaerales bacterium]